MQLAVGGHRINIREDWLLAANVALLDKKSEGNNADPDSLSSTERDQLNELQRENKELKTANEILRRASSFMVGRPFDRQSSTADPSNGRLHRRTS